MLLLKQIVYRGPITILFRHAIYQQKYQLLNIRKISQSTGTCILFFNLL